MALLRWSLKSEDRSFFKLIKFVQRSSGQPTCVAYIVHAIYKFSVDIIHMRLFNKVIYTLFCGFIIDTRLKFSNTTVIKFIMHTSLNFSTCSCVVHC